MGAKQGHPCPCVIPYTLYLVYLLTWKLVGDVEMRREVVVVVVVVALCDFQRQQLNSQLGPAS